MINKVTNVTKCFNLQSILKVDCFGLIKIRMKNSPCVDIRPDKFNFHSLIKYPVKQDIINVSKMTRIINY